MAGGTMTLATAISGGAQVASAIDQRKAEKRRQRKLEQANAIERARASVEKSLARRQAIAQARQAQAFNIAGAATQGVSVGSSPVQGAGASIYSDLGSSIASANRTFVSGQAAFDQRQSAAFTQAGAQANAAIVNAATQGINRTATWFAPTA